MTNIKLTFAQLLVLYFKGYAYCGIYFQFCVIHLMCANKTEQNIIKSLCMFLRLYNEARLYSHTPKQFFKS